MKCPVFGIVAYLHVPFLYGKIFHGLSLLFHRPFKYECSDVRVLKRYRYFTLVARQVV